MESAKLKYWVGCGLGSGLLPSAPGTWGSLAALVPAVTAYLLFGWMGILILFFLFTGIGFWSAGWFEKNFGKDPASFVMDEWAGQMIPLFNLFFFPEPSPLLIFSLSFLFFRFFDIVKPFGIHRIQSMKGAAGIMLDDILAGVYALGTVFFVIFTYYTFF